MSADAPSPTPPPDPSALDPTIRPVEGAYWERLAIPGQEELIDDLGSAMLGGTDIVVIWSADPEVAEPEVHEPKFVFNPLEGLSRDTFPKGSGLTTDERLYARAFVDALKTGTAKIYTKGGAERVVEDKIKDRDGNVTHLVVSWMEGGENVGKKKQTIPVPVAELEQSIEHASNNFVIEPRKSRVRSGHNKDVANEAITEKTPGLLIGDNLLMLAREYGYSKALGGFLNMGESYHLSPDARSKYPYRQDIHGRIPFVNGQAKALETGVNIGDLVQNQPFDRYKFYLSLDLSTPDKKAAAQSFMSEVHSAAAEQQLAMLTKPEDHDYDSCDIYTWSPTEFATILESAYKRYPGIWLTVEHPLQGAVGSVDKRHIGMVQEPVGGTDGNSHSGRMTKIGAYIDEHGGELSPETWEAACDSVNVRPDEPWLLNPNYKSTYMAKYIGRVWR